MVGAERLEDPLMGLAIIACCPQRLNRMAEHLTQPQLGGCRHQVIFQTRAY